MAVETALHRVDAESAAGDVTPIDTDLAVDAIDELFEVVLTYSGTGDLPRTGATIHLHATDADLAEVDGAGEWLITVGAEGVSVTHEHAKGDVAVRGPVSDLLSAAVEPPRRRGPAGVRRRRGARRLADPRHGSDVRALAAPGPARAVGRRLRSGQAVGEATVGVPMPWQAAVRLGGVLAVAVRAR